MKKNLIIAALLVCLLPAKSFAQDFFYGFTTYGSNLWLTIPQAPLKLVNSLIGGGSGSITYDWLSVSDSQGKIEVDGGNPLGFQAKDLFASFGAGFTVGYHPLETPIGGYIRGGYKFRQFRMQMDRAIDAKEKFKVSSWSAGAGIRLTPFLDMLDYYGWEPQLEVGTDYNKAFSCTAPFDNATAQFGSGFASHISLGARICYGYNSYSVLSLFFELPHYNYFNKDFTTPDGFKPYADVKSKNYVVGFVLQQLF